MRGQPEPPSEQEAEVARYTVVLVPPEAAEALGYDRSEAGLKIYLDNDWDYDVRSLDEAATQIEEDCGVPVTLVEHHADLCYWTTHVRRPAGSASR
ncbi:hypothetical protein ACNTMW_19640 [Planosporangium sp. 12N6]|uniref:hypothetical protein n=1 Tax=Planosporangium spinosum TaxID=3402278 RepID=UPI003CF72F2E